MAGHTGLFQMARSYRDGYDVEDVPLDDNDDGDDDNK